MSARWHVRAKNERRERRARVARAAERDRSRAEAAAELARKKRDDERRSAERSSMVRVVVKPAPRSVGDCRWCGEPQFRDAATGGLLRHEAPCGLTCRGSAERVAGEETHGGTGSRGLAWCGRCGRVNKRGGAKRPPRRRNRRCSR